MIEPGPEHLPVSIDTLMRKPDAAINQVLSEGASDVRNHDETFANLSLGQFRPSAVTALRFRNRFDSSPLIDGIVVHRAGLRLSSLAQFRFESAHVLYLFAIVSNGSLQLLAELKRSAGQFPLR
jgi:hypothetical protein